MTRAAIALIALLILTLSAGFTTTSIQSSSLGQVRQSPQTQRNAAVAGELDVRLLRQPAATGPATNTSEEGPAPALLAYLGLVIVGSVLAIANVRASQRAEI